jgi:hypothetical protein
MAMMMMMMIFGVCIARRLGTLVHLASVLFMFFCLKMIRHESRFDPGSTCSRSWSKKLNTKNDFVV